MTRKYRVGVAGLIHDHVWSILKQLRGLENVDLTSAADLNEPLLARVREEYGVKRTYKSYEELFKREELDAVLIYTENSRHAEITEMAAERGINMMVEKPMAATLEQAERMMRAARKYGVRLMVNYPTAWFPGIRYAHKFAAEGNIGRVFLVRYRAAHQGPKEMGCSPYFYEWLYNPELNGAGAYMDYCCYGANMSRWILGMPEKVTALGGTYVRDYLTVEDNAILIMGYPKAMGIAEASWSQVGDGIPPRYTLILTGSDGVVAGGQREVRIYLQEEKRWRTIQAPPLEEGRRNAPEHFIKCIDRDEPFDDPVSLLINRDTQIILEAGLISMKEDRVVYIKDVEVE